MILDIKRNYKVSGKILKYIKELKSIYCPLQVIFKNIEFDRETRELLDSAKICSVVQNDEQGVEVIEFQREYRDFLIGKILYLFEEDRKWDYYDEEVKFSSEDKPLDENKEYAVKGTFLYYISQLASVCEKMNTQKDIVIGKLISEFEKCEWEKV